MVQKLSKWFKPPQTPWEPGFYFCRYKKSYPVSELEWDGENWWVWFCDSRYCKTSDDYQWRGLAKKP